MPLRVTSCQILSVLLSLLAGWLLAGERPPASVPPTMEIEVLDPGVDPLGNPAVQLRPGPDGQMLVDIPPVILVHRYYYSGDRSFQGPLLPGGPSIIVANHPATGERCYVQAQMRPGTPRVNYTSRAIEFDYDDGGITICFGPFGPPSVKYRSGRTLSQKTAALLHTQQIKQHCSALHAHTAECMSRTRMATGGALVSLNDCAKVVTLPVHNTVRMLPFAAMVAPGDLGPRLAEKAAQHRRDHAAAKAERDRAWEQLDFRTIR